MKSAGRAVAMKHDRPPLRYRAATERDRQRLNRWRFLVLFVGIVLPLAIALHAPAMKREAFDIDIDDWNDDDNDDYGHGL